MADNNNIGDSTKPNKEAISDLANVSTSNLDFQTIQNTVRKLNDIIDSRTSENLAIYNQYLKIQDQNIDLQEELRIKNMKIDALEKITATKTLENKVLETVVKEVINEEDIDLPI